MKNSILGKARWLREAAPATSKNNGARVAQEWLKYAAMFVMLLTLGIGNVWGADVTSVMDIPNSATASTTSYSATESASWTLTKNCATQSVGTDSDDKYYQIGSGSKNAHTMTWTSSSFNGRKIKQVVVYCSTSYSSGATVSVSGTGFSPTSQTVSSSSKTAKTFNSSASGGDELTGDLVVTITFGTNRQKNIRMFQIDVKYAGDDCTSLDMSTVTATTDDGEISLSWTAVEHADSYTVACVEKSSGDPAGTGTGSGKTGTSCTITGLTNGTEYTWSVTPVGSGTYCAENDPETGDATPNVTYTISYHDATGAHSTTATGGQTLKSVLPASPTSCDAVNYPYFVGWKSGSISGETTTKPTILTTEVANSTTSANTYYAVWSDVSPIDYATTYTSNVTLPTSGTNAYDASATISSTEYDAAKLGKSGAGGTSTFSIPSGTTTIYLHAYSWYNEDNTITLSVPSGVTISPSTDVSLPRNSNFSGSSNDYTLDTPDGTQFKEFTLTGVNAAKTVTIESTGRALVFGINAVSSGGGGGGTAHYITTCCTQLGTINGSVSLSQTGSSITISGWTYTQGSAAAESNIDHYTVYLYSEDDSYGTAIANQTCAYNSKSVTFSSLTLNKHYKFKIAATGNTNYCNISETEVTEINSTSITDPFKFGYSIFLDDGTNHNYAHHWITYSTSNQGTYTTTLDVANSSPYYYQFKVAGDYNSFWAGQSGTSEIPNNTVWTLDNNTNNIRLKPTIGGTFIFTVDYTSTPTIKVTFPSADQAANKKIWFDNSGRQWSTMYYRIGTTSSNQNSTSFTLVPGTDQFYVVNTLAQSSMEAWHIANNASWSGAHSIYYVNGSGYAITQATVFQKYAVDDDGVTLVPTTAAGDPSDGCQYYNVSQTSGMLTHTATIGTHTNGTISLAYTDVSGTAQNKTATTAGLAHRTKITATATANTGYQLSTFTVTPSGESAQNITSGQANNHILAKDATFDATFTAKTYDLTLDPDGGSGSNQTVTATYGANMPTTLKGGGAIVLPTRDGYDFEGYYSAKNGGGTQYYTSAGASARTWNVDDAITLYAYWTVKSYTLTWDWASGSCSGTAGTDYTAPGQVNYGATITYPTDAMMSREGYDFAGWSCSPSGDHATMPASALTITAQWNIKHYTVTWKVTGSADDVETYDHGDALVIPSDPSSPPACSDKKFVGWKDGPIDGSTDVRPTMLDPSSPGTVTADKAYYAVFADDNSGSVTITASCMPTTGSDEYKDRSWSATGTDGTVFTGSIYNYKTGSASFMQFKNEGSPFYNSTATPSPITKIEMKKYGGTDRSWTPRVSATTVQSTSAMTGGTNLTGQGVTASGASWELDEANEYKYVYLGVNGGTQIEYIKIYYGSSSGYVTECSSCTTPSNLAVSGITSTGGKVTWEGVSLSPTEGFTVAWNTSNSVPSPLTASNSHDVAAGTNEYAITGLTAATQYYVFVKSKCNDAWSSSADFYTNAKITYAAGSGALGSMDPKEVTYNTDAVVDACTFEAPTGKTFNGWVSDQAVTVGGSSTTSVPDGATISNLTKAITLTAQWRDLAVYHVTFSADNGTVAGGANQNVTEGGTLTFPNVTGTSCGTFKGWVEAAYDNATAPSGATYHAVGDELAADPAMDGKTYYAVYLVATGAPTTINDVITSADLAATSAVYAEFDDVTKSSSAVYKGETAKNGTNDIQLRSNNSTSGIVSKISGGLVKKVTFVWGTGNNSGRTVDIYGKNSAYTAASDLYGDAAAKGTSLGSIVEGTSTEVTVSGDYEYVGIRSNSGAAYIASITIQWYGSPMKYQTSPVCSPVVGLESSFSAFTYVYNAGPSAAQSFTVSGNNLSANLVVTAPTNYEVSKTENGTYTSSVNYTPTEGTVSSETVYIRLAAGRNVGTYNYAAASGVSVASEGATTRTAALNGSVTQATGAIAFTNFNAVDHYEAEMPAGASGLDVTLTVSVTGDGAVSYSKSPTTGVSPTIPATQPTTTLHVLQTGTWTVTANLAAGTNYTSASTSCQVVVYYADRFYDNIHADVQELVSITLPIVERGSYVAPDLMDADKGSANCAAKHYKFMGWVSEANITAGLPNDDAYKAVLIPAGTPMTATGTNYYAVWAEDE